jgi:hypothetical protein
VQLSKGAVCAAQLSLVGWHQGYQVILDVPHPCLREGGHLGILLRLLVPQPLWQALAVALAGQHRCLEVVGDRRNGDQGFPFLTGPAL